MKIKISNKAPTNKGPKTLNKYIITGTSQTIIKLDTSQFIEIIMWIME